jgi:hypothetical protein
MKCPSCGRELRIGQDGPIQPERTDEIIAQFAAGEISLAEFDAATKYFYIRNMTCPSQSIPELEGKPCPQFGKVVETIKIYDR